MDSMIFAIIGSIACPRCQCHTKTRSCSGSIQIVFDPLPSAAKLDAGALGHCFFCVLSHHRKP
jgi:hypothetical protein